MIGHRIIRIPSVGSTMDTAAELAANGANEGLVVVADEQTAGRGRAGRSWRAPAGSGVFASVVLRPHVLPDRLGRLALVAGIAVAKALETFELSPTLKWPNDVWLEGRKVAGILTTTRVGPNGITAIVGIGINVTVHENDLPHGATSLHTAAGRIIAREDVLQSVLRSLDREYETFIGDAGNPDLSEWTRRAALLDEFVTIQDGVR